MGKTPGQFGEWLRRELTQRGYDLQRGGQSRLAREADVAVSIINRTLKGERIPEIDGLRRLGRVLGFSLGEMLIAAELAVADELPIRPESSAITRPATNGTAVLTEAMRDLRALAEAEGKTMGEMLVEHGLAARDELVIPPALPPDPVIEEILASSQMSEDTKATLVHAHLANRAQRFEEARVEREKKRKRPGA